MLIELTAYVMITNHVHDKRLKSQIKVPVKLAMLQYFNCLH